MYRKTDELFNSLIDVLRNVNYYWFGVAVVGILTTVG